MKRGSLKAVEEAGDAEDFHEDELFEHGSSTDGANSDSEDRSDCEEAEPPTRDDHGESSAKSSLTVAVLGASGAPEPDEGADDSGDQLPALRTVAASMPVHTGHVRMGSSVPVSIPHMSRWKKQDAPPDSPTLQYASATFVPPHQLSQVNDFMFSFTGDSPSVAIKRERLRVRNAILKSTGFLEPGVQHAIPTIGLAERNRLGPITAGGLSQALQPRQSATAIATAVEPS